MVIEIYPKNFENEYLKLSEKNETIQFFNDFNWLSTF